MSADQEFFSLFFGVFLLGPPIPGLSRVFFPVLQLGVFFLLIFGFILHGPPIPGLNQVFFPRLPPGVYLPGFRG
jgi:hypothetical protein